jgi:hypothetical protein
MTIPAHAHSPTLPRKRGRGQQRPRAMTARPTILATLGALWTPSPACGGGVGRGRVPLAQSYGKGPLRPNARQGSSDG